MAVPKPERANDFGLWLASIQASARRHIEQLGFDPAEATLVDRAGFIVDTRRQCAELVGLFAKAVATIDSDDPLPRAGTPKAWSRVDQAKIMHHVQVLAECLLGSDVQGDRRTFFAFSMLLGKLLAAWSMSDVMRELAQTHLGRKRGGRQASAARARETRTTKHEPWCEEYDRRVAAGEKSAAIIEAMAGRYVVTPKHLRNVIRPRSRQPVAGVRRTRTKR